MGRYYWGDIDGKFWFAVQSSDAADRFGVRGSEPNYIEYYFSNDHLQDVQDELERIEKHLGVYKDLIDEFFKNNHSYTDEELAEALKVSMVETKMLLSEYADYQLGKKIEKSILDTGECSFTAEL
jgi:hypothetical protein